MICKKCNRENDDNLPMCLNCGTPLPRTYENKQKRKELEFSYISALISSLFPVIGTLLGFILFRSSKKTFTGHLIGCIFKSLLYYASVFSSIIIFLLGASKLEVIYYILVIIFIISFLISTILYLIQKINKAKLISLISLYIAIILIIPIIYLAYIKNEYVFTVISSVTIVPLIGLIICAIWHKVEKKNLKNIIL